MNDRIGGDDQRLEQRTVAHVATDVTGLTVGIGRPRPAAMHLRLEDVEHGDRVAVAHEPVDEMRADVAGATGDENRANGHIGLTGAIGRRETESQCTCGGNGVLHGGTTQRRRTETQ
jgi:hypothetical protein